VCACLRVCCLHARACLRMCVDLTVNSSISQSILHYIRPKQIYCADLKIGIITSNIPVERISQFLHSKEVVNSNFVPRIQIPFLASIDILSRSQFRHRSSMGKQATAASPFIFFISSFSTAITLVPCNPKY
jgi:hypothetical protein